MMITFEGPRVRPAWALPLRCASAYAVNAYARTAYRVRGWGELPKFDCPTLIVSNHQIDIDLMAIISAMGVHGGWRTPFFSVSARMLYEPGFFAVRLPWLAPLFRNANLGWLFGGMGLLPIENEIRTRSLARWAYGVSRLHGSLPLEEVFLPAVLERCALAGLRTNDLFTAKYFEIARMPAKLSDLLPRHRREQFEITARDIEADLERIETRLRAGATIYLTPEGEYSRDGAMLPFRGIWPRLAPVAHRVLLAPISYDPFVGRRLSQLYRIVPLVDRGNAKAELKAARPVTVSALLSSWLLEAPGTFSVQDAVRGTQAIAGALPAAVFVDPEYAANPQRLVAQAIAGMHRLKAVIRDGRGYHHSRARRHPSFERVADIVAFQARFLSETIDGALQCSTGAGAKLVPRNTTYGEVQRSTPSRESISR